MSTRTWVPLPTFLESAKVLHDDELHRSRVSAHFILQCLVGRHQHMQHNPSVTMWRGAELMLVAYGMTLCTEYGIRGFRDSLAEQIWGYGDEALNTNAWTPEKNGNEPWWLGHDGFHMSHKSGLIQRRPSFYRDLWPSISPDLPMVMPRATEPKNV